VRIEPKLIEHIEMGRLQVWLTPLWPCEGLYPELALDKGDFYVRERGEGAPKCVSCGRGARL